MYYEEGYGYLKLKTRGRPSDHSWYFPYSGESDHHWTYISYEEGSFETPKGWDDKGKQGEVYYSEENKAYYIFREKENHPTITGISLRVRMITKSGYMPEKTREPLIHLKME